MAKKAGDGRGQGLEDADIWWGGGVRVLVRWKSGIGGTGCVVRVGVGSVPGVLVVPAPLLLPKRPQVLQVPLELSLARRFGNAIPRRKLSFVKGDQSASRIEVLL